MAKVSPALVVTFRDRNGKLLSNGSLHTFEAGTDKPLPTYTSAAGTNEAPNPIPLGDSATVTLWLGQRSYKFVVKDSLGRIVRVIDRVSAVGSRSVSTSHFADEAVVTDKFKDNSVLSSSIAAEAVEEDHFDEESVEEKHISSVVPLFQPFVGADLQPRHIWNEPDLISEISTKTTPGDIQAASWQSGAAAFDKPGQPAWSPDSKLLGIHFGANPNMAIYERCGNQFFNLPLPGTLPTGGVVGQKRPAFSPNGEFIAFAHDSSPYISIYKRNGAGFAKLSNPASLPNSSAIGVAWSPNGRFLAVCTLSKAVIIYEREGLTFAKLDDPDDLPVGSGFDVAFSPDGRFLALGLSGPPFLQIYEVSDDTFTKLEDPDGTLTSLVYNVTFSPDGKYLATTNFFTEPYFRLYQISGTTFIKVDDPGVPSDLQVGRLSWSHDSKFIALALNTPPFLTTYRLEHGALREHYDLVDNPIAPVAGCAFSPDSRFLAVTMATAPWVMMYETSFRFNPNGVAVYEGVS